eukprot:6175002-Pleurochrysis_carterae.AAC.1
MHSITCSAAARRGRRLHVREGGRLSIRKAMTQRQRSSGSSEIFEAVSAVCSAKEYGSVPALPHAQF